MAKVPDLGSDFAQKLLLDLRRRRETLESQSSATAAAQQQQRTSSTAAPLWSVAPSRRDAHPAAARAVVPSQGGGGGETKPAANNAGGKLQNGSMFLGEPGRVEAHDHRILSPGGGGGGVAIGVQRLDDVLMACASGAGAGGIGRRSSADARKKILRDPKESLRMFLMIVDEDPETDLAKNMKNTPNASVQIVAHSHRNPQGHSPSSSSAMQLSDARSNSTSVTNASAGGNGGSKVRVPNVIAKLMGLENFQSAAKAAAATEKLVKPEALRRNKIRANAMDSRLPIRIAASDRVLSEGPHKDSPAIMPCSCKESEETAAALTNCSSHHATDNPMKGLLIKTGSTKRGGGEIQGDNERIMIIHEGRRLTEEIKLPRSVGVGCHSDSGKKMDLVTEFRRNSGSNRPVMEEKHTTGAKNGMVGEKQVKQLLGREAKSRKRERLNKENLATTEANAAGKNGKTDQMKRLTQTEHADRRSTAKNTQNCRAMRNTKPSQNSEEKMSLNSEAVIDSSSTGVIYQEQCAYQITEDTINLGAVQKSGVTKTLNHQITSAEKSNGRTNHTASETAQTLETVTDEEKQQQQQLSMMKAKPMDGDQILLKKMLRKDQYLLETAEAIAGAHAPVSSVDAAPWNSSDKRSELLSDAGREVIGRKGRRTEAMVEAGAPRAANPKAQHLDDLVGELGGEISGGARRRGDDGAAETLLHSDIKNGHPGASSTWDLGWNSTPDLPIEKSEVVRDLEKMILGGMITDVARDLISLEHRPAMAAVPARLDQRRQDGVR